MTSRNQSDREKAIRKYFGELPESPSYAFAILVFFVGIVVMVIGSINNVIIMTIIGLALLGFAGYIWWTIHSSYNRKVDNIRKNRSTDKQIDDWLDDALARLSDESLGRLNLVEKEIRTNLIIKGPILWTTSGIDNNDLVWRIGKDNTVRFGVYRVTVIQLTDRHLASYACDYNFIRDVALNEKTDEYHYKDIVSVSTQEQASSYTLPTGVKLTTAQEFKISVSSGESIKVTVGSPQIREITGSDQIPETGVDRAINVIRTMLRDKKG